MPFNNFTESVTTISTYNDIGRDQHNNFNHSVVHIYHAGTSASASLSRLPSFRSRSPSHAHYLSQTVLPFATPTKEPYRKFIDTILEIQDAIEPLVPIVVDIPLNNLISELSEVLTTTALVGALMEILDLTLLRGLVWYRRIADRVHRWTDVLEPVIDEVRRYREGLRFTVVGPIWRRILWSAMWHLSADSDIIAVVERCHHDLGVFKQPLLRLLAMHSVALDTDISPRHRLSDLQRILCYVRTQAPLQRPLSYRTITSINFKGDSKHILFDSFATHQDLRTILETRHNHRTSGSEYNMHIVSWVDPSDHQLISPKKLATLHSQPPTNVLLHPLASIGPLTCYEDRDDICPRCRDIAMSTPRWMECSGCGLRFRTSITTPQDIISGFPRPSIGSLLPSYRYVLVERYAPIWSYISTLTTIRWLQCDAPNFLALLRQLARVDAPLEYCSVEFRAAERAVLIPSYLDEKANEKEKGREIPTPNGGRKPGSGKFVLGHLLDLIIDIVTVSDAQADISILLTICHELHAPRLTTLRLIDSTDHAIPIGISQLQHFFFRFSTLRSIGIAWHNWDSDISIDKFARELLLHLPHLASMSLRSMRITPQQLRALADLVEDKIKGGSRGEKGHPLAEISLGSWSYPGDTSELPDQDAWQVHAEGVQEWVIHSYSIRWVRHTS